MDLKYFKPFTFIIILDVSIRKVDLYCGCKTVRPCYDDMLRTIAGHDEVNCIENASIGSSTATVFLKAVNQFCSNITEIINDKVTFEGRRLYEVIVSAKKEEEEDKPVIVIDAGQEAGTEPVTLALYLIQQLVMCEENQEMIEKAKWVILPSTNPDGQEFARTKRVQWRKNFRPFKSDFTNGVDISRNFEGNWKSCSPISNEFSPIFPGLPASEVETVFVQNVLNKYKKAIRVYLSIRRGGHSISFPYAYDDSTPPALSVLEKTAGAIASRVNQRAGGVQLFTNQSIYSLNRKERCGHSVDYAHQLNILHSYEMRVFMESENKIMTKLQTLPRGYNAALRNGYYSGIKELYNIVIKEKPARYH